MPIKEIYHNTVRNVEFPNTVPFQSLMSTQLKQRLEYGLRELSDVVEIRHEIRGGVPVLKGTRIPVAKILAELGEDMTLTEIAEDYNINIQQVKVFIEGLAILLDRSQPLFGNSFRNAKQTALLRVAEGIPNQRFNAIKLRADTRADTQVCPYKTPHIQGL